MTFLLSERFSSERYLLHFQQSLLWRCGNNNACIGIVGVPPVRLLVLFALWCGEELLYVFICAVLGGGFDAAICYKTPPNASFSCPTPIRIISITHTSIPMKASTVVKLLLVAYIPLSAYYSATNVFEETTMDLDVSHSFFIKCILDSSRIEQDYLHQQQFGVHRYVEWPLSSHWFEPRRLFFIFEEDIRDISSERRACVRLHRVGIASFYSI